MEAIVYICLAAMLLFGILAVMHHSILKSAIWLALASASLGVLMYTMGAVWSALFEISVCSGLVTVIFVSAISLSNTDKSELGRIYEDRKRMSLLPVVLIAGGILLFAAAALQLFSVPDAAPAAAGAEDFAEIFWNSRQTDILGQMIVAITGSVAVVALFKERDIL